MFHYLTTLVQSKLENQKGQGLVEYAVVLAVVVAIGVALTANGGLQAAVNGLYTTVTGQINGL